MPPSEAERHGYERVNKYPKSTKFGRQNPITARWNSDEQLVAWRENWAQITNKSLDEANRSDAHIDHRSHAARGIDEQPTVTDTYTIDGNGNLKMSTGNQVSCYLSYGGQSLSFGATNNTS